MSELDVRSHNRAAWDQLVEQQNRWTVPVSHEAIERARRGEFEIVLTPTKPVPRAWFENLDGVEILCLASGGGQQGPLLAAAGARVTVLDNSPNQLKQDQFVAQREGLVIRTVEGDMADLSIFADESFQLIVHPCSNCFAPDVRPVWRECFRVLRKGGALLAGFNNPLRFLLEDTDKLAGMRVSNTIPYSDLARPKERAGPLEFGHSLADQIGGQLEAGFLLSAFYEDRYAETDDDPISRYIDTFIATRAIRPD